MVLPDPVKPVSLDDYRLGESLGSGAMARVFDAVHRKTSARVAIKLLDAAARGSRELRERLAREAVFLASLQSPHVSRLLGYGWEGEQPFLVLERLEGETLASLLRRDKRLAPVRLIDWVEQLLLGLRDCHRASVIHRDIKPSNIFLERAPAPGDEPSVKLIDFGVARLSAIASAGASLTSTHHLLGSVGYMAPEQLEYAKGVGPAADLYGVGVVVFRCLAGRLPFVAKSFDGLMKLKTDTVAPLLSSVPGMPENDLLDEFLARALLRDPAARFPSATDMLRGWWRVAAALDRETALPEVDVVFDEEDWVSTLAGSLSRSGPGLVGQDPASSPSLAALVRTLETDLDGPTDPQMQRPSEAQLAAAFDVKPPSEG